MTNSIFRATARINELFKIQAKRFLTVVLVGFLLLTTNVVSGGDSGDTLPANVEKALHQNDSQRPKTTGEWNKEARETEDAPGERVKKIAGESGEALKEFGGLYPDTAKRSADSLK